MESRSQNHKACSKTFNFNLRTLETEMTRAGDTDPPADKAEKGRKAPLSVRGWRNSPANFISATDHSKWPSRGSKAVSLDKVDAEISRPDSLG